MGRWVLVLLAGCGRFSFDPRSDASVSDVTLADAVFDAPCETSGHWNRVPGGDFESADIAAWFETQPTRCMWVTEPDQGVGAYSIHSIPIITGLSGCALQQDLPVSAGPYMLSGYFRVNELVNGDQVYLDLNDTPFDINLTGPSGDPGWHFLAGQVDVPSGTTQVTLRLVHDGNLTSARTGYADEIALTPVGEFTAPAAPCL